MLQVLIYFFIALSLSIDAFSISLSLGTTVPTKSEIIKLSSIVGTFHFIMPIVGSLLGNMISNKIPISCNFITFLIFIYLAIEMFKTRNKQESFTYLNLSTIFIIALTVSLDSFSVGVAIGINKESILIASTIFMLISGLCTSIGLTLGKKLKAKYQQRATLLGIFLLLFIAIKYLFSI